MPVTINGVGTHYYGQRNAIARQGVCKSCKRLTTLTSYDTTLYFVVIFVPLLPLGRKRIVDSCASCRRHYVVPLKQFLAQRERDYAEAERLTAATPPTQEAFFEALRLVNGYREPTVVSRYVARTEAAFPESADAHLFVAETHRLMSNFAAGEAATARSLTLRESDEARESLAEYQFARDDVEAGRATLGPILDRPSAKPSFAVKMGAEALQRAGRHAEALELLSRVPVTDAPPELATQFAKLRAASERTLERAIVEPERYITDESGNVVVRKRVPYQKARWALAAATVAVAGYAATSIYLGTSHRAFLVNGLDRAYTVRIDNHAYLLQPREVKPIRVSEGDVAVAVNDPAYTGSPQRVAFATNFWTRPFSSTVLAINPDGQAAVFTGTVVYARGGGGPDEGETLHTAEVGYQLTAQYAFENPPASVSVKSGGGAVTYTTAYADHTVKPSALLAHLANTDDGRAKAYAQRMLEWPLADADGGLMLASLAGRDEAVASLKARLRLRPVEVETHRLYQQLQESADVPLKTRQAEYRSLLAAEPTNPSLQYLLARILDDAPDEAAGLYQQAEAAAPPEPMAFAGDAYQHMVAGDFEASLKLIREARRLQPARPRHALLEWEMLYALGRYPDALAALPEEHDTENASVFERRLETVVAAGGPGDAETMIATRQAALTKRYDAAAGTRDAASMRSLLAYLQHNERAFASAIQSPEAGPTDDFTAAISKRDLAGAEAAAKGAATNGSVDGTANDELLMLLAADATNDAAAVTRHREAAVDALNKLNPAYAALGDWLKGTSAPTDQKLKQWAVPPDYKALALTALGVARPAVAADSFRLAAIFDYRRTYPHELLVAERQKRAR